MDRNYIIYKPTFHAYLAFGVWRFWRLFLCENIGQTVGSLDYFP